LKSIFETILKEPNNGTAIEVKSEFLYKKNKRISSQHLTNKPMHFIIGRLQETKTTGGPEPHLPQFNASKQNGIHALP
jgi:hypothetical protein